MQWSDEPYAGVSRVIPWLPVNSDYFGRNVRLQVNQGDSLLTFYRLLIGLRKTHAALMMGTMEVQKKGKRGVLSYIRKDQKETLLIILNFTPHKKRYKSSSETQHKVLLSSHRKEGSLHTLGNQVLFPYEATVFLEFWPVQ
jgi:glycosidase